MYHEYAEPVTDSFAIKYTTYSPYPDESEPGIQAHTARPGSTPQQTCMVALYPNPFTNRSEIHYQLAKGGTISLVLYDATGRKVNTLAEGLQPAGYCGVVWDGCDDIGRKVPAGVYFVSFESEGYQKVNKTILLR